jgi:hypothetical protein
MKGNGITDFDQSRDPGRFSQSRNPEIRWIRSRDFGIDDLIHFYVVITASSSRAFHPPPLSIGSRQSAYEYANDSIRSPPPGLENLPPLTQIGGSLPPRPPRGRPCQVPYSCYSQIVAAVSPTSAKAEQAFSAAGIFNTIRS